MHKDECDKGAHQPYLGTERNIPLISNWFNLVNAAVVCAILESISTFTQVAKGKREQ